MYSSIDVTEGIFIADKSKTVQSSMKDLFGTNDWNEVTSALQGTNKKLTHFQRVIPSLFFPTSTCTRC